MTFCHYSPMKFRQTIALILAAGLLTGCAAGGNAPTRLIREVTDGVESDAGAIKLRNVKLVALPDGSGTLIAFLVSHSDEPDQLVAISINGQMAQLQSEGLMLKNQPIIFEGESANAKAKVALLGVKPGYRVPVAFYFANGGKVELDTLIVANTGIYSSIL
jgi:hypothetical protein